MNVYLFIQSVLISKYTNWKNTQQNVSIYFLVGESSFDFFFKKLPIRWNTLSLFFCGSDFSGSLTGVRGSTSGFDFLGVKLPQVSHISFSAVKMQIKTKTEIKNFIFKIDQYELLTIRHFKHFEWNEMVQIGIKTEFQCNMQTTSTKSALVLIWQASAVDSSALTFKSIFLTTFQAQCLHKFILYICKSVADMVLLPNENIKIC